MDHEQDLKLSSRIFNGKYQPNHDTIDAMSEIAETVRYLFDSLQLVEGIELTGHSSLRLNPEIWPYVWVNFRPNAEEREKIKATAIEDFKRSQGDLDLIQVVLFPRVIRCNDQEIITAIAELDSAIIDLRRIIPIYEDMPNSSHSVIYSISQLLGKCQQLYSALCEKWVIDE